MESVLYELTYHDDGDYYVHDAISCGLFYSEDKARQWATELLNIWKQDDQKNNNSESVHMKRYLNNGGDIPITNGTGCLTYYFTIEKRVVGLPYDPINRKDVPCPTENRSEATTTKN